MLVFYSKFKTKHSKLHSRYQIFLLMRQVLHFIAADTDL